MFSSCFYKCLFICSILIILLECTTSTPVERWVEDDHFNSGRRLLEYVDDTSDILVFFVVFVVGILITFPLLRYMCKNGYCGDGSISDPDISAVVHPPPRHLTQQPQLHMQFANSGFVHSQVVLSSAPPPSNTVIIDDKPPDYSTVMQGDMAYAASQAPYPRVMTRDETRPHDTY